MVTKFGAPSGQGDNQRNPLPFPIEANETRRSETTTFTMYPGPKPPTPHVPGVYRFTATALGAGMWFFLMYRAKKDGPVLLGWKHPWDH
ncbi:NADH dehydrogenase [ubiquinone] 1 beta subcomplex subunit 2 [Colletotrichum higginsianum]|uniref:NADH dehydrogenase [ubiquinone] 1 beta subcomplex subunit 2 n=1 Tax=Colletotrichum higginsianum TaxID=80884 RepID=A0A4T0W1J9_9PEZI|nr:NADH dehydrogenase [ubiquinone] 1 beta subcomplex subunit 2 [Colletotrichum higginsianum]